MKQVTNVKKHDTNICMRENIIIGALIVVIIVTAGYIFAPKGTETASIATAQPTAAQQATNEKVTSEDLVVGEGAEATPTSTVVVNYKGTLEDGTQFDSSYDRGEPFETPLGVGAVIQGWDQGIPGMKVGGKRKLTIPASLGYGAQGQGSIPPNSTLIFEVELLEVK